MCGGNREIQSRRPPRLAQEMKPNTPHVAADGALLLASCCPARRQPAAAAAAGLAIVAALEAELVQSGSATAASKPAESAPPASPTSPLPIPIPIAAASAHEEMINEAGYTVNKNHSRAALQRSIFSTSLSPPSTSYMTSCNLRIRERNDDFLGVCFSCKRPLGPGKDIYMYRGDRAFCSMECRHKHITTDESLLCKVQINQQCVQASYPTNQSKFTPSITIRVLI